MNAPKLLTFLSSCLYHLLILHSKRYYEFINQPKEAANTTVYTKGNGLTLRNIYLGSYRIIRQYSENFQDNR